MTPRNQTTSMRDIRAPTSRRHLKVAVYLYGLHMIKVNIFEISPQPAIKLKLLMLTQDGIVRVRDSLVKYLDKRSKTPVSKTSQHRFLKDFNYTLAVKRTHHAWRSYAQAGCSATLQTALSPTPVKTRIISDPRLAFVFTGQGAQWPAMGRELISYPVFRRSLYDADKYLSNLNCPWSLTCMYAPQLLSDSTKQAIIR